ncbi:ACP S-malonyltransferase [Cellulomonas denverensis]|uniref:[acyl-carrier-protein] S-malonyltransferase n=1 Tax=Cellulomonas denverensis TaxID=264297 RepID=A0A7X6KX02_9CELL|nr:ACP S-malonyltransferase [Cellulomonas denverensis]NKY23760.1 ACP S-malonyltransferase [Cellulomonas denverensis]GIG25747.1 ACP S-malonyltransferase [Cellulomonas denverensis]
MLAIVCPGQGAQTPGMLGPWLELPGTADRLAALSEAAGLDLTAHGTTSDAETIRDTAVAQPLIVSTSLLSLRALEDELGEPLLPDATAGHSVGEFAAAAVAGVFDDAGAVGLVTQRARFMAEAAAAEPTGMTAVLGGDPAEVTAAIEAAGLWPANVNGGGQIVAAGSLDAIAAFAQDPPARARVIPLQVAGAFHTPFMQSALDAFGAVAADWPHAAPRTRFLTNADGSVYAEDADVLGTLVRQIAAPVRWDLCQATLAELGVTALLELAPGGVLKGLARRSLPGVETLAITSPEDLPAARDLVAAHLHTDGSQENAK